MSAGRTHWRRLRAAAEGRGTLAVLYVLVLAWFAWSSPAFLETGNLLNILVQSSSAGIVATGMTLVLLTAGIDLSVGAVMLVSAAVAGKMALLGIPLWAAISVIVPLGAAWGVVNAFCVTRLRIMPFVATLAMLYLGRGLGLWITETRALNLPDEILRLGSGRVAGIPFPIFCLVAVAVLTHGLLTRTAFGRYVYAVGQDREIARRSGIPVISVIATTYVLCGAMAALGGLVSVAQLGAVSPTFGSQREFAAVAAAVLGGTSLFGGRGDVLPGTVLGAILVQTVENGLVVVNADPYLYPLAMSSIIFVAVLADSLRSARLQDMLRRRIRGAAAAEKRT